MDQNYAAEGRKKYLKFFAPFAVVIVVLAVICTVKAISRADIGTAVRTNHDAPAERVYDYADLLTDEQENALRQYIAEKEAKYCMDFVIMTFSQPVEGREAKEKYGYRSTDWESNMMDIADNFWDENGYGFNKSFEGDGSILIDNRYVDSRGSQRGEWLSTSGIVYQKMSNYDIEAVLNAVDQYYDSNPYKAYIAYIDQVIKRAGPVSFGAGDIILAIVAGAVCALIFMIVNISQGKAKDTASLTQYVEGKMPVMRVNEDQFLRKHTTTRRIESSGSGGGGGHRSAGGARHGGGGHRH